MATRACVRCRQRKKKCDQRLPKCRLCELAGVDCVAYDAMAGRHVPRSYVHALEERVAELEIKLRDCTCQAQPAQAPTPIGGQSSDSPHFRTPPSSVPEARAAADLFASLSYHGPGQEPTLSQVLTAEVIRLKPPAQESSDKRIQSSSDLVGHLDTGPVSLPEQDAVQSLVKAYFRLTKSGMPLLHEPTFQKQLDLLHSLPQTIDMTSTHASSVAKMAIFFVFGVFAVAILSMQKQDPSSIPTWLADRYHRTAVRALQDTGLPSSIQGVQALLLLAQYSYHHPTLWSVWNTVGAALRLAVELRLHEDPAPDTMDALALDTRRRTFWVAYSMDRNLSTSLALPTCLSDGAISVEFPSLQPDELITPEGISDTSVSGAKRIALHIFRYRQIQSALQTVLYQRLQEAIDFNQWQLQMRQRIDAWHQDIPDEDTLDTFEKGILETLEVTYNTALLRLYRPSPNIPFPSEPQIMAMAQAAMRMIQLYRQFFREHKLTIYWQSVENITSAGIALMYGYAHSPDLRASLPLPDFESLIHTCSSVLWGMVERFPSFKGRQDAFDLVASKTLSDLGARATSFAVNETPIMGHGSVAHNPQESGSAPIFPFATDEPSLGALDVQDMEVAEIDWDSIVRGSIPFPA